ncbi:MAG: PIG-L family deacetylase [Oscillospiraceae bacterium]|jgi:LmbE family N-acetylglucosaminyl deacetylase|nr:PIG-L family deacetylase [Oscillospiraceae bacterium]
MLRLHNGNGGIFIPDGTEPEAALRRTTDLCIAAHQDDVEIMAYGPIAQCYEKDDRWFAAVVVTDGAGSPRAGRYASLSDLEMQKVRVREQVDAARLGKYAAVLQLGYPSAAVKAAGDGLCASELRDIVRLTRPDTVYTHNLADKHDTHVGVTLRVLEALRPLPPEERPLKLYALEVWRGLDWLPDGSKAVFDTSPYPELAADLLRVFASQCAGGKRYDKAAPGRRLANAAFFSPHHVDSMDSCSYGLDITPLMIDETLRPGAFIGRQIEALRREITGRIGRME